MRRAISVRVVSPLDWVVYPALVAIALTILLATPLRVFGLALPEPVLPLVLAFAWPMIRPSVLAPIVLFGMGLFLDMFWGGAVGLWPLALMAVYGATLAVRTFVAGQTTTINFILYTAAVALAFFIGYIVTAFRLGNAPAVLPLVGQMLPTILLFPVADWLMQKFDDNDVRFL